VHFYLIGGHPIRHSVPPFHRRGPGASFRQG
jgi:hypothetical protein